MTQPAIGNDHNSEMTISLLSEMTISLGLEMPISLQ
jgi:hypothetical protein